MNCVIQNISQSSCNNRHGRKPQPDGPRRSSIVCGHAPECTPHHRAAHPSLWCPEARPASCRAWRRTRQRDRRHPRHRTCHCRIGRGLAHAAARQPDDGSHHEPFGLYEEAAHGRPQPEPQPLSECRAAGLRGPHRQRPVPTAGRKRGAAGSALVPHAGRTLCDDWSAQQHGHARALCARRKGAGPGTAAGAATHRGRLARHLRHWRAETARADPSVRASPTAQYRPALWRGYDRIHALTGRLRSHAGMRST